MHAILFLPTGPWYGPSVVASTLPWYLSQDGFRSNYLLRLPPKSVILSEVRRQPNAAKDLCICGKIVRVHVGFRSRAQDLVPDT